MNSLIHVARELALEAGQRIMVLRQSPLIREQKDDHSLVTNADREADRIIRNGLQRAFPQHSILTEENGLHGSAEAEYLWVVDPLDGTRAYAKGVTGFSVMIGLLKDGKPHAGVVFDPLEGYLYEALKGEGAWMTFTQTRRRVHVSKRSDLLHMPVITSTGFPKLLKDSLRQSLPGPWVPAVNSVGVKVGHVVRQDADIYINHHSVHYWDTCAPHIILEEAGGIITYINGAPLTYALADGSYRHAAVTLVSNGVRHPQLLEILQSVTLPSV